VIIKKIYYKSYYYKIAIKNTNNRHSKVPDEMYNHQITVAANS